MKRGYGLRRALAAGNMPATADVPRLVVEMSKLMLAFADELDQRDQDSREAEDLLMAQEEFR